MVVVADVWSSPFHVKLGYDILLRIIEESRDACALRPLSLTCRYIRSECMPVLFQNCVATIDRPITERFIPATLWPFIRCADAENARKDC